MKKTRYILSILTAILGVAHVAFTPMFYHYCTIDAMWFAGTGLSLVFLGLANALLIGRNEKWTRIAGLVANFAALTLMTMIAVILKQPQAWLGCILTLGLFSTAGIDKDDAPAPQA